MVAVTAGQVAATVNNRGPDLEASALKDSPTSYVFAVIEDTAVQAFIDTGSEISLISESLRMSIPALKTKSIKKTYMLARSVTGECLDTLGTLTISIRLGEEVFQHDVQVIRNSNQAVILGWDFLQKHHAVIDVRGGQLQLWNGKVPLLFSKQITPLCCNAVTLASISIPAMTQMNIMAKLQPTTEHQALTSNYLGILEPEPCNYPGLFVARTMSPVKKGLTTIRVMNPTNEDCQVPSNTPLGSFYSLINQGGEEFQVIEATVNNISQTEGTVLPKVDLSQSNLSVQQKDQLENLLFKYCDVFSSHEHDYGRTDAIKHHIRTGDAQPIRQRAYRTSPALKEEIEKQVQQLLSHNIIEESCSPWASPVVLVKKKDGSYRFCIDFRKINAVTIRDSHPLPQISEALDSLAGACWFSTMDLSSGYWQVELASEDREKTAFTTGSGLYHFKVMPMGLTNAPPTFQRLMELVLRGLHWKICLIYLDDVLVFNKTFPEHLQSLEDVFLRFRKAGLKLKASKCQLAQDKVSFLGHVISKDGLRPDSRKLDKVKDWPIPRTPTEVRAFVGLCSYYRRFVKNFAQKAAPLHSLTQKGVVFKWTPECDDAFFSLKLALTEPPVVAYPNFALPFLLYTDASQNSIGSVLAQVQDRKERVIAYASHTLTPTEKKWSTYDRELWAIVWSIRHFKHFLAGSSFKIVTDHKPLLSLKKSPVDGDPTGRRGRWILELDVYDCVIIHREGARHANADALSRRPDNSQSSKAVQCLLVTTQNLNVSSAVTQSSLSTESLNEQSVPLRQTCEDLAIDLEELKQKQQADVILRTVMRWKEIDNQRPTARQIKHSPSALKKLWYEFPRLTLQSGILCRKVKTFLQKTYTYQLVLPESLIQTALTYLHGNVFSGHLGTERTLQRARKICYWPYMSRDIYKFCTECLPCQTRSAPTPKARAPLQSIVVDRPFQKIAADLTELPVTSQGNRYVLVVMDYFTRYVNLFPLKDQRATSVAQCLFEEYIRQHGIPESIHTDQGRQFESDLMKQLCSKLGIEKTRTSPYHAQSDGMVERLNRTLKDQLAKYIYQNGGEWDKYLSQVELAYNSSVHSSTGYTPFFLAHGREPRLPVDVLLNCSSLNSQATPGTPAAYAQDVINRLSHAFEIAAQQSKESKLQQKTHYDQKLTFHPYAEGDLVFLDDPANQRNKLAPRWKGPYKVLKRLDREGCPGVTYEITDPKDPRAKSWIVHYNRLKAYKGPWSDLLTRPEESPRLPHNPDIPVGPPATLTVLSGALPYQPPAPASSMHRSMPSLSCPSFAGPVQSDVLPVPEVVPELEPRPGVACPSSPRDAQGTVHQETMSVHLPRQPQAPEAFPVGHTRSGRQVKKPEKFRDFVVS